MQERVVPLMASASIAHHPMIAAPRSASRTRPNAATRHRPARPPQPRTPGDFFTTAAQTLLTQLFIERAERWQQDSLPPMSFYGRESEPHWNDVAQQRCSGTALRIAGKRVLCESLCMDLERGPRLLALRWTADGLTSDGHTSEEWRLSLAGVLWC